MIINITHVVVLVVVIRFGLMMIRRGLVVGLGLVVDNRVQRLRMEWFGMEGRQVVRFRMMRFGMALGQMVRFRVEGR